MHKLFDVKFPGEIKTLPDGFWSAVDVWIKKPHVVNKRLCGAAETESRDAGREELRLLLDDAELFQGVMGGLSPPHPHRQQTPWSHSVRTFIPKVNCYGTNLQKEIILKGKSRT